MRGVCDLLRSLVNSRIRPQDLGRANNNNNGHWWRKSLHAACYCSQEAAHSYSNLKDKLSTYTYTLMSKQLHIEYCSGSVCKVVLQHLNLSSNTEGSNPLYIRVCTKQL